jgi:RNA polymerase sigma-54 factor
MRLVQRMSQRVVMTPLLQQAIHLLQLSTLELKEVVEQELRENPLLEEVQAENEPVAEVPGPETADLQPPPSESPQAKEQSTVDGERSDDLPFDLTQAMFDQPEERTPVSTEERDDLPFENLGRTETSLTDHLMEQLRMITDDPVLLALGESIIGNLDDDGYLRAETAELAEQLGRTVDEVDKALLLIQSFDPSGVAARSIQECLLLQLRADSEPDPISVEIVEKHMDDLERRRYPEIARALKQPLDRIMESVEEIQGLEPKPGRRFVVSDSRYIAPDVTLQKIGDDYVVVLNDEGLPRLRVNSLYRSLLRGSAGEDKQFVEQKLRSALWLIKSVEQRQRTIRKVATSLVKFQRDFFDRGLAHLRPLALRDVGEDIGMHESTISRVTTNKYIQTPQGLYELKWFFHSGIASNNGDVVSSVSVKKTIQDLVAGEDAAKPYSDQDIAKTLHAQGLTIARRTVAKYREELGISPSHQRRMAPKKR